MIVAAWALGCTGEAPPDPHPADDRLSVAHAQTVGTHNSYHVETTPLAAWAYTHAPLDVQLAEQGVRQFELDLYWVDGDWSVFHVPVIDEGTTCFRLSACLAALRAGSDRLGPHLPVVVLLEVKDAWTDAGPDRVLALEQIIADGLGASRLLPATLQGDAPTLRDALIDGWPVLSGQRGRFIPVVHDRGEWASETRALALPSLFTDAYGDLDAPWAAVHSINDPSDPRIRDVVLAGHLVRTRADANVVEPLANDTGPRDLALESGAHFVSTDFPVPHPETGYVVRMPGGTPARCNPVSAPADCEPALLEDPDRLGG